MRKPASRFRLRRKSPRAYYDPWEKCPYFGPRELVRVEMEALLERERADCARLALELEKERAEIESFQHESVPAYTRWFQLEFGARVAEVQSLQYRAAALADLISQVEYEAAFLGIPAEEAYLRIERARLDEELAQENASRAKPEDEGERRHADPRDEAPDEDFAEQENLGHDERGHADEAVGENAAFDFAPSDDARLKQLYRRLARLLHPDANGDLSARERELWHEVQSAYDARDLERLETLAAFADGESADDFSKIASVARLRAIFDELAGRLEAAQRALRKARRQPEWNFILKRGKLARINRMSDKISGELEKARAALASDVACYEELIEEWKAAARPKGLRRKAPRGSRSRAESSGGP